jgi:hypothetical protein
MRDEGGRMKVFDRRLCFIPHPSSFSPLVKGYSVNG